MTSIIIPVFNEADNLSSLIPYLHEIKSDFTSEILICVSPRDCDLYNDLDVYEHTKIIKCDKHSRASQMNTGAIYALGEILVFLHADVTPPPTFFNDISQSVNNGIDAGYFAYQFDKSNLLLQLNASMTKKKTIFTGGGDQCLFIKKTTFKAIGSFDESQVIMEDYEFYNRMKKSKIAYTIIPKQLIVSARKYEENSYLKVNISNLLLFILFKCGLNAKRLRYLHDNLFKQI